MHPILTRTLRAAVALFGFGATATLHPAFAAPEAFHFGDGGTREVALSASVRASAGGREIAAQLAGILKKITGQTVEIQEEALEGIVLGLAPDFPDLLKEAKLDGSDPFTREDYLIRSSASRLLVVGASPDGLRHGVADLLHRWGYRQFFPSKTWEIIPKSRALSLCIDEVQRPAFAVRDVFGTSFLPGEEEDYEHWNRWNRMGKGFRLNTKHSYNEIYKRNAASFNSHPEYFAEVDGKRQSMAVQKKFNPANPGLRRLVVEDAKRLFAANPGDDSVSMDPSDLRGWDNTGEASKQIGGASNQAVTLANAVAREAAAPLNKYVGIYAYAEHQYPPEIPVEPNVIVSFATRFLRPDRDLFESIDSWKKRGVKLVGIRDYSSFWPWDRAMPGRALGGNLDYLSQAIPEYYRRGARFYTSEFQGAWGPYGLGFYLTSRLLWNPQEDPKAVVADFLEKSFGPAARPMGRFYALLNGEDSVLARYTTAAQFYAPLLEAMDAAKGDDAIRQRIADLLAYVRYVELTGELETAREEKKPEALQALYEWVLRTAPTQMLPTRAMVFRKYGMRSVFGKYTAFSEARLIAMQQDAANHPATARELVAFAEASVSRETAELPLPLQPVARPMSSPWVRNAAYFLFPLRENEPAEAFLSMRRFGFSLYPRYVVLDPQKNIVQRGRMSSNGAPVVLQGTKPGNYALVIESTPNLIKCRSDKSFYLNPTRDSTGLEMVEFRGKLHFSLPEGVSTQLLVGGQGEKEKVNVTIASEDGETLASAEDVNGDKPEVLDLQATGKPRNYTVTVSKPTSGNFEDLFLKFNGGYSCPVSLFSAEERAGAAERLLSSGQTSPLTPPPATPNNR